MSVSTLPEFDASRYVDSKQAIAKYLTAIIEEGDSALFVAA